MYIYVQLSTSTHGCMPPNKITIEPVSLPIEQKCRISHPDEHTKTAEIPILNSLTYAYIITQSFFQYRDPSVHLATPPIHAPLPLFLLVLPSSAIFPLTSRALIPLPIIPWFP